MRRTVFFLAAILFLSVALPSFSQETRELSGTLVPHDVYVGDTANVFYTLQIAEDLFTGIPKTSIHENRVPVSPALIHFEPDDSVGLVLSAAITKKERAYELSITFVPWKTGSLLFAPMNINALVCSMQEISETANTSGTYILTPLPFEVLSMSEKLEENTLRELEGPLLLPGTRYVLVALVILLIAFLTGVVFLLVQLPKIRSALKRFRSNLSFKRNEKLTCKKLSELLSLDEDDSVLAEKFQGIMRSYLSKRFSRNFSSVPSRKIFSVIDEATSGFLEDEMQNAAEEIAASFVRTDYIRFAKGSLDSMALPSGEHEASFFSGEKHALVQNTVRNIRTLERKEKV